MVGAYMNWVTRNGARERLARTLASDRLALSQRTGVENKQP
jgi:hypothetical protein